MIVTKPVHTSLHCGGLCLLKEETGGGDYYFSTEFCC